MEMNQKECGIVCKENGTEQIENSFEKNELKIPEREYPPERG